jgi:hypothetical protein
MTDAVSSRDVPLAILERSLELAISEEERNELAARLAALLLRREEVIMDEVLSW